MFLSKLLIQGKVLGKKLKKLLGNTYITIWLLLIAVGAVLVSGYFLRPDLSKTTDPFELGEYYFNAYDTPDGEYDLKLARQYYTEAIEGGSENPTVWYQLGRIDFLEGNYPAALYKFDKQIALYGEQVPSVYYMKGLTYGYKARKSGDASDWQKAEENFLKFLEDKPESPWTRTDLSWVYFSQGKFAEMVPLLEEGLSFEPQNPWLLNMYGLSLMNTDRRDEARTQFEQALEFASYLGEEDWGRTYPGNDPAAWQQGLVEFQSLIKKNLELTKE